MRRAGAATRRHLPTSPFRSPMTAPLVFAVDDRVTHDRHGLGTVIGVETGIAVLVDFGSRRARIVAPYPKLSRL